MRRRLVISTLAAIGWAGVTATYASALEAHITDVRTIGPTVRAAVDVRDVFPEKFRQILQSGGTLHMRVQAELWIGSFARPS